ncbi:MAG: ribosome recycling factor [Candidatus Marinimicrobia bacterium]|nr:ribosome recycling factor [Candidatus Neomarinimicrobiota bacterium]
MINELHISLQQKMNNAVEHVRNELATLRTGRANPRMIDHVKIDYYGSLQPLKILANISAPEPRLLVVEPFDKTQIGNIEKSILLANIGMTPSNDSNVIRLPIPELTEERRGELVKVAHEVVEEGKVSIRNARRDTNHDLKTLAKDESISDDNVHRAMDNFQELTDNHIKELDEILNVKEQEILHD